MTDLSLRTLVPLAAATVRAPREVFARLLSLDLPRSALWQALALVVIVSVILAEVTNLAMSALGVSAPGPENENPAVLVVSPLAFGVLQGGALTIMVVVIHWVGRMMGGTGTIEGSLMAVAWLQFVMVCLQVVQSVAIVVAPAFGGVIVIAGLVLFLWLLTNFVAELHGFNSLARVFGMILFTMIGIALIFSFGLTLAGVTVPR